MIIKGFNYRLASEVDHMHFQHALLCELNISIVWVSSEISAYLASQVARSNKRKDKDFFLGRGKAPFITVIGVREWNMLSVVICHLDKKVIFPRCFIVHIYFPKVGVTVILFYAEPVEMYDGRVHEPDGLNAESSIIQEPQRGFPCTRTFAQACFYHLLNQCICTFLRESTYSLKQVALLLSWQVAHLDSGCEFSESFGVELYGYYAQDRCEAAVVLKKVDALTCDFTPHWICVFFVITPINHGCSVDSGAGVFNQTVLLKVCQVEADGSISSLVFQFADGGIQLTWIFALHFLKQLPLKSSINHRLPLGLEVGHG